MERNSPSHYNEYPASTMGALKRGSLRMYECGIERGRKAEIAGAVSIPANRASGRFSSPVPITSPHARKSVQIRVENGLKNRL